MIQIAQFLIHSPPNETGSGKPAGIFPQSEKTGCEFKEVLNKTKSEKDLSDDPTNALAGALAVPVNSVIDQNDIHAENKSKNGGDINFDVIDENELKPGGIETDEAETDSSFVDVTRDTQTSTGHNNLEMVLPHLEKPMANTKSETSEFITAENMSTNSIVEDVGFDLSENKLDSNDIAGKENIVVETISLDEPIRLQQGSNVNPVTMPTANETHSMDTTARAARTEQNTRAPQPINASELTPVEDMEVARLLDEEAVSIKTEPGSVIPTDEVEPEIQFVSPKTDEKAIDTESPLENSNEAMDIEFSSQMMEEDTRTIYRSDFTSLINPEDEMETHPSSIDSADRSISSEKSTRSRVLQVQADVIKTNQSEDVDVDLEDTKDTEADQVNVLSESMDEVEVSNLFTTETYPNIDSDIKSNLRMDREENVVDPSSDQAIGETINFDVTPLSPSAEGELEQNQSNAYKNSKDLGKENSTTVEQVSKKNISNEADPATMKGAFVSSTAQTVKGFESNLTNAAGLSSSTLQQIANEVDLGLQKGKTSLHIQLEPEGLGTIDVKLSASANGVGISIVTEKSSTGQLLESQIENLRQSLKDAGLDMTQINFSMNNQFAHNERQFFEKNQSWESHGWNRRMWNDDEDTQNSEVTSLMSLTTSQIDYRI